MDGNGSLLRKRSSTTAITRNLKLEKIVKYRKLRTTNMTFLLTWNSLVCYICHFTWMWHDFYCNLIHYEYLVKDQSKNKLKKYVKKRNIKRKTIISPSMILIPLFLSIRAFRLTILRYPFRTWLKSMNMMIR